jgi:hypothetical protein
MLAVCALGTVAGTAWGQSADAPSPCASVTDDRSRLQCYDAQEAMKTRNRAPAAAAVPAPTPATAPTSAPATAAAPAGSRAPEPVAYPAPVTPADPSSEFGLQGDALAKKRAAEAPKDSPAKPERLVARVKAVTGRGKGDYRIELDRIELDNGQLWVETQRTGGDAPDPGETVTIRPGLLGSYFLEREAGLALRVKRIK